MRCWLIEIGEPLPFDPGPPRLMRTGLIAEHLVHAGHQVVWWASRFSHTDRSIRPCADGDIQTKPGLVVRLLDGYHYQSSVGIKRMVHHRAVAAEFRRRSRSAQTPDVIICGVPTLELAAAAVNYGRINGIPVLLDLRDMWPDMFFEMVPRVSRPLARMLCQGILRDFSRTCRGASGLIGITDGFLAWGLTYAKRGRNSADRVVPHAYPSSQPTSDAQKAAGLMWDRLGVPDDNGHTFVISFIGSLSKRLSQQGHLQDAVAAASQLAVRYPNLKLVICGGGEDIKRWQRIATQQPNVVVSNQVNQAEVWTLLSRSTIGLVPYPNSFDFVNSIPNKVGEYLSMGLPIVSSLDGALGSFLRHHRCGESYRPGGVTELIDVFGQLHDDSVRIAQMSEAASVAYWSQLAADRVYPHFVKHVEEVVSSFKRARPPFAVSA